MSADRPYHLPGMLMVCGFPSVHALQLLPAPSYHPTRSSWPYWPISERIHVSRRQTFLVLAVHKPRSDVQWTMVLAREGMGWVPSTQLSEVK